MNVKIARDEWGEDSKFQVSFIFACCCFLFLPSLIGISSYFPKQTLLTVLTILVAVMAPIVALPVILNRIFINAKPGFTLISIFLIGMINSYSIYIGSVESPEGSLLSVVKESLILWGLLVTIYIASEGSKNNENSRYLVSFYFMAGLNLLILINLFAYFVLGMKGEYVSTLQESLVLSSLIGTFFERVQFPFFSGLNSLGVFGAILFGAGVGIFLSGNYQDKDEWKNLGLLNFRVSILLGLLCIFLADTRSAYLLALFTPLLLIILRMLSNTLVRIYSLLIFFVLPLAMPFIISGIDIVGGSFSRGGGGETSGRYIVWAEAIRLIQAGSFEEFLFGRGPTLLQESNLVRSLFSSWTSTVVSCHNTFLNQFYTLGLVGATFWIALTFFISLQIGRLAKSKSYCYHVPILFTILLISSFESLNNPEDMLIHMPFLWSVITLIFVSGKEDLENEGKLNTEDQFMSNGVINHLARRQR